MPENTGLFKKYHVERLDGKPITGPVFVLDLGSDPKHSAAALRSYGLSCSGELPDLAQSLWALANELASGTPGPMMAALATPREE